MRVNYKGHEIEVVRVSQPEKCLAGYFLWYHSIFCNRDGYCLEDSITYGDDSMGDYIKYMVERIENEFKDGHKCAVY